MKNAGTQRNTLTQTTGQEEQLLLEHDEYIVSLARKKVPRGRVHPDNMGDDIDELAQRIRIKLWLIARKQEITAARAYIRQIAATVSVDMLREQKPTLALPVNEEGECYEGRPLFTPRQEEQDPAALLTEEESLDACMMLMAAGVLDLPPVQQQAMLHSLKQHINDLLPFLEILQEQGADIEGASMPADANQQRSLRTSLSIARKKMRALHSKHNG